MHVTLKRAITVTLFGWMGAAIGGLAGPAVWESASPLSALFFVGVGLLLVMHLVARMPEFKGLSPTITTLAFAVPTGLASLPIIAIAKNLSGLSGLAIVPSAAGMLGAATLLGISLAGAHWAVSIRTDSREARIVEALLLAMAVLTVVPAIGDQNTPISESAAHELP